VSEAFEPLPMIDATYRTNAKRDARAIAGLSMGVGQALRIVPVSVS
jgi:enterochelin esterase-like enzyme